MAGDLTLLLQRLCRGEAGLEADVFERVYGELRQMAQRLMKAEPAGHTLQPTALVHDAYLRLVGASNLDVASRAQFFHAAARAMRQVLVDHARARLRKKRGGGRPRLDLSLDEVVRAEDPTQLLAVDEALCRLEEQDPRAAEIVRLRVYGGLDNAGAAEVLGVSKRTVEREWTYVRSWLFDALR